MTKVSVVIPSFNGRDMVRDTVAFALSHGHPEVEVVVVDDGSTDPVTMVALEQIKAEGRAKVIAQENRGPSGARNRGIDEAAGDYILPLDHDDEIHPDYAAKAAAVLDARPEVGIVYARVERFGASTGEWSHGDFAIGRMLMGNVIHASAMFRRADWIAVGGYSEEMRRGWEDHDFWLNILGVGREVVHLDEVLFRYRDTEGSFAKAMALDDQIDALAHNFATNSELYVRHTDEFVRELLGQRYMLAHFKRRYGRAEDALSRAGALRRRFRGV